MPLMLFYYACIYSIYVYETGFKRLCDRDVINLYRFIVETQVAVISKIARVMLKKIIITVTYTF